MKTGIFPPDTFRKLERLFEDRQVADYDWNLVVDRESAEQNLADAEWLVKACREYIKPVENRHETKDGRWKTVDERCKTTSSNFYISLLTDKILTSSGMRSKKLKALKDFRESSGVFYGRYKIR